MRKFMLLIILFSLSCQSKKSQSNLTSDYLFQRAKEFFDRKKYSQSAELFKEFVFKYPLSDSVDAAQYYLAKSYKEAKRYDDAITEYLFLINTFPTSKYVAISYLELAECYMEKSKTISRDTESINEAKRYIEEFKDRFPDSPEMERAIKLERSLYRRRGLKYLYIADNYLKIGQPKAADVYIDLVFEEFSEDDSLVKVANILKIKSYLAKRECDSARLLFEQLKNFNDKGFQKSIKNLSKAIEKSCKK